MSSLKFSHFLSPGRTFFVTIRKVTNYRECCQGLIIRSKRCQKKVRGGLCTNVFGLLSGLLLTLVKFFVACGKRETNKNISENEETSVIFRFTCSFGAFFNIRASVNSSFDFTSDSHIFVDFFGYFKSHRSPWKKFDFASGL